MAPSPPDPPSHDETMIESSILEVPPSYSEPALPARPVRKGPIVASLLLAGVSLAGGGFVLYGRSLDAQEQAFLALAQESLDSGRDPGPALAAAAELPGALRSRVSVQSLTEQLEARVEGIKRRAQADLLLSEAGLDQDLAARGQRLAQAQELDPESPRLQALLAHHQLEVWAQRAAPPRSAEWEALSARLARLPATPAVLTAQARVTLQREGRDPGARSDALASLAKASQIAQATPEGGSGTAGKDPGEARWASYARAWRGILAQEPRSALAVLDELLAGLEADPILGALAATLRGRARWTIGDLTGAAADLEQARRSDSLAEGPATWWAWILSEAGAEQAGQVALVAKRWPRSAVARAALAQVKGEGRDLDSRLRVAREALALDRGSDLAHLVAGRLIAALGRLDEAFRHAVKAVLWGRSLAAHLLRIELGLARRDPEFAQHDLRAAQALAPQDDRVALWAGRVELRAGRPREALRLAEALQERSASWVEGHVLAARALGSLARWKEASQHVEQAMKLDPEHLDARLARAQVLVETHQSVLALTDLEQLRGAALKGAMAAEAAYLTARAHRELGEVPRARAAYQLFVKLAHPKDVRRRLAARYLKESQ